MTLKSVIVGYMDWDGLKTPPLLILLCARTSPRVWVMPIYGYNESADRRWTLQKQISTSMWYLK